MSPAFPIPSPDALPVPAPIWFVEALLHFTFLVHIVAMNCLLGGAVIAVVERFRAGDASRRLAQRLGRLLPTVMAFTVTFGVAPLLFLQTMYGHLFYTSSVMMAWPWFFVIPTLIVTYYLAYVVAFRGDRSGGRLVPGMLVALGLLVVAFIYTNNMTLALRPEKWGSLYASSAAGLHANLDDPTLTARYLHFVLGAIAVAGMVIALWGAQWTKREPEDGRHMAYTGAAWFLATTAVQFGFGFWLLIAQPRPVMMQFMGESGFATLMLALGTVTPLAAALILLVGLGRKDPRGWFNAAAGILALTLGCMIAMRDVVRDAMLAPHFDPGELSVQPQTGIIVLFVALLALGVGTVAWMVRALVRSRA